MTAFFLKLTYTCYIQSLKLLKNERHQSAENQRFCLLDRHPG